MSCGGIKFEILKPVIITPPERAATAKLVTGRDFMAVRSYGLKFLEKHDRPTTILLRGTGLLGLAGIRRRKSKRGKNGST